MQWDDERRQLVSKMLADGFAPDRIAERLGVRVSAVRSAMQRYGLAADMRGTRVFTTARGTRVRRQVKPRVAKKVTLAKVGLGDH